MRVVCDLRKFPESPAAAVVTLGNFDGVHLAHKKLLRRVVETARLLNAQATAITFEPHPTRILAPKRAPKLLTPLPLKTRLIEKEGIDLLVVLPFTRQLAQLTPEEFVRSILIEKLQAAAVIVGPSFRFGHRRSGDIDVLGKLARQEGFKLEVLPALKARGERVSSTQIRELLSAGRVGLAGRLLGRPFSTLGPIVPGLGVGKEQTVPTLNLAPVEAQLPKTGVYVTRTTLGRVTHESVTNVGYKPTFGQHPLTVESYLLNFVAKVNQTEMEIEFLHRLRDERKFPDPASLKAQIQADAQRSLKFFRLLKLFQEGRSEPTVPSSRRGSGRLG